MLFQIAFDFRTYITYLQEIGVYEVFLPFLLIFAIVFAVLEKTKIFGEKPNINVVIAFIVGLLLVVQKGIVETINQFLPRVALIIVVALAFLLVLSMIAGKEFKGLAGWGLGLATLIAIGALAFAFSPTLGGFLTFAERNALLKIGLPVLGFILAIWLVIGLGRGQSNSGGGIKKFLESFDESLRN